MDDSSYYEIDEDVDWIIIEKLLKNRSKVILVREKMLSIGIIWNSANHLKKDILDDVNQRVTLSDSYEFDLGESYIEFVRSIYLSEQMEEWKIDNKINHMIATPTRKITILFFEFDSEKTYFHPFKKKAFR